MMQKLATCSLVLVLGCSSETGSPTDPAAARETPAVARRAPPPEPLEPLPPVDESSLEDAGHGPEPTALAATDPHFDLFATPEELEAALVRHGPLSPEYAALGRPVRHAVATFFARGPGASPAGGEPAGAQLSVTGGAAGGAARATGQLHGDPVPGYPGLYNVTFENTGTGYVEKFLLQVPDTRPAVPAPMLVVFHKYGVSHADVLYHTSFIAEARARGWYLIAPLGLSGKNFGSLPSQINVETVLDYALGVLRVDPKRVYGVGFSMGGGGAVGYAARHHAPGTARFAAVADHTGTVSLAHAHANEGPEIQATLESLFGGTPASSPFDYQRCSSIDLDPSSNAVLPGTDMVRNLRHVPIRSWLASNDPQPYLPQQTLAFGAHVQSMNAANQLTVVAASTHDWSTLDETVLCDWFAGFALQQPTNGTLLADEDGAWHRFLIEQSQPGAFTAIDWSVVVLQNRIVLGSTRNLTKVSVDALGLGLAYQGSLFVDLSSGDGTGDQVRLLEVPHAPIAVLRNGQPASAAYDAAAQSLSIDEAGGSGTQHWTFAF